MNQLHPLVTAVPLAGLVRIDLGLEGDWSGSVVTVWRRNEGLVGFEHAVREHAEHTPSLELYYEGGWVGVHCFTLDEGVRRFDESMARRIIDYVEAALA